MDLDAMRDLNNAAQRAFTTQVRQALQAAGFTIGGPQSGPKANAARAVTLSRMGGDLKPPACRVAGYTVNEAKPTLIAAGFTVARLNGSHAGGPWLLVRPTPEAAA